MSPPDVLPTEKASRAHAGSAEGRSKRSAKRGRARNKELTSLEREFLPHVLEITETPPSPLKRLVLWTIVGLLMVGTTWACVCEMSVVSSASGKIIPDGRVKQIQPLETSVVKAIHVKEGQHVHQGQLLLELDPRIAAAELDANTDRYDLNRLEQARLTAELKGIPAAYGAEQKADAVQFQEDLRVARESAHAARLAEARALVQEKTSALAVAEASRRKYEDNTAIAQEREESARPLVATGAISRLDYLQLYQDLLSNRHDLAAQTQAVEQARHAKTEAEQRVAHVQKERLADIYADLGQKQSVAPMLKGELNRSRQLYELKWLKSPVTGLVQKVDVTTIGAVVTPAQNLVTIVPAGTPLIVEASLSNEDVGYVHVGQNVEIKVDTFPFQKYGTVRGTLMWVSPDAEDQPGNAGDWMNGDKTTTGKTTFSAVKSTRAGYSYKVHIRPQRTEFIVNGKPTPLLPGMSVRADIATDRRRVIEFLMSPVLKYWDEGMKVR